MVHNEIMQQLALIFYVNTRVYADAPTEIENAFSAHI